MACKHLAVRTRTRVSQDTAAAMLPVKQDYCRRIMMSYRQRINNPKLLINMDETAIYLNCSPKSTVHSKSDRTVSIRLGGAVSTRFTLSITVAMDGTKLPLFVILKGKPGGSVDKRLPQILPDSVFGCVQPKALMDNRTMRICYDSVFKPYITQHNGEAGLLLDDFICHKSDALKNALKDDDTHLYMIPPHYTGLLQPCDVGINKSLKDRLQKAASNC